LRYEITPYGGYYSLPSLVKVSPEVDRTRRGRSTILYFKELKEWNKNVRGNQG
jgi:hypothetical protein